jgi:hypothetical protein
MDWYYNNFGFTALHSMTGYAIGQKQVMIVHGEDYISIRMKEFGMDKLFFN